MRSDARVITTNPAWDQMLDAGNATSLTAWCGLHDDDAELVTAALGSTIAERVAHAFELDVPALGLDRWARLYLAPSSGETAVVAIVPLRRLVAHSEGFDPDAFVTAYEYLSPAILLLGRDLGIKIATGFVSNFLGQSGTQYEGRNALDEIHPDDHERALGELAAILHRSGESATADVRVRDAEGVFRWVEATAINLLEHPNVGGILVMLRNVEQRKQLEAELAHRATHDALTGLPNRTALLERLTGVLSDQPRSSRHVAVMFLDLDNLKDVNDSVGHEVGDELLVEVARRLEAAVRPSDLVCRLGGDEFVAVCPGLVSDDDAVAAAERIRRAISGRHSIGHHEVFLGASIGLAVLAPHRRLERTAAEDAVALLRDADTAMYDAKTTGRARVSRFSPQMHARATDRMRLAAGLAKTVDGGELRLVYQPIFELGTDRIVAAEALLRWDHPERGELHPSQFLSLAEETGQIVGIGAWVLERALADLAAWRREGHEDLAVHINVSPRQAAEQAFSAEIIDALEQHRLPTDALVVEVAEQTLLARCDDPTHQLDELHALGVALAFDDFGTGSSSLSLLRRFPVSQLKLDGAFVGELASDPAGAAVTRSMIELAHALGMVVVAEAVSTPTALEVLRRLGCDRAQGHVFGAAIGAEQLRLRLCGRPG